MFVTSNTFRCRSTTSNHASSFFLFSSNSAIINLVRGGLLSFPGDADVADAGADADGEAVTADDVDDTC